jgi:hypothetical protein
MKLPALHPPAATWAFDPAITAKETSRPTVLSAAHVPATSPETVVVLYSHVSAALIENVKTHDLLAAPFRIEPE